MNLSSTMLSMLLHAAIILAVWLWPTSPPLQLDKPMMQISLTMGAPGGDRLPSAVLGPQGQVSPSTASNKPAPPAAAQQAAASASLPEKTRPEKLEAKAEARPESQKEVKPIPTETKPEPVPTPPKPAPKEPEAALVSPQRKPEPTPKPDPKPEPKPTPKPEAKPEPKPAPASESKAPSADDILRAALSDAKTKAGPSSNASAAPRKGSQSIAGALAAAERQVRQSGQGGGGGGEGSGPGGGGIYDVYAGMVILAVRPNWSMPTYSRDVLVAQVRVRLDPQGNILNADIARSSGRADFDASCVNAVLRTKVLPAPPTPDQLEITIGFNSQEMMGR